MSDFGDTVWPVARKTHRCEWCGEAIPVGEKHAHYAGRWENEWQNWRMHSECLDAASGCGSDEEGFMPFEHKRGSQEER